MRKTLGSSLWLSDSCSFITLLNHQLLFDEVQIILHPYLPYHHHHDRSSEFKQGVNIMIIHVCYRRVGEQMIFPIILVIKEWTDDHDSHCRSAPRFSRQIWLFPASITGLTVFSHYVLIFSVLSILIMTINLGGWNDRQFQASWRQCPTSFYTSLPCLWWLWISWRWRRWQVIIS